MATVLLLDDSAIQLSIRRKVLEQAGFVVLTAEDAPTAFTLLAQRIGAAASDAIITDHIMPEVSGSEFVRRLRRSNASAYIPIIVISGLLEAEEEYAGLNVHFRYKPCAPQELIELVRSLTDPKYLAVGA